MIYTPFANHTDDELLQEVARRDDATELEIELSLRLELLLQELEAVPVPAKLDPRRL